MSRRRAYTIVTATIVAAALVWGMLGNVLVASGQEEPIVIARAHAGEHAPTFTEPIFILALGGDARSGNPERQRFDSIHIIAIDPETMRGSIVGIPRDTYVSGRKLTEHGYFSGVAGMVDVVEELSRCTFDYSMATAFEGFGGNGWNSRKDDNNERGGLINDLGGVTMNVPGGLSDVNALGRIDPIPAGKQTLNGAQALAWSRSRYDRPRGDFDRSLAQGTLLLALMQEMQRDYKEDPGTALRNIAAVRRYVRLDIPVPEALRLGLFALRMKPKKVRNIVVDGFATTEGGASVVRLTQKGLNQLADVCSDGVIGG